VIVRVPRSGADRRNRRLKGGAGPTLWRLVAPRWLPHERSSLPFPYSHGIAKWNTPMQPTEHPVM
jgi:hypothetical protein